MTVGARSLPAGGETGPRSKHAKYASGNPVNRFLVGRLFGTFESLVRPLDIGSAVDVGCGEGLLMRHLEPVLRDDLAVAVDHDPVEARDARRNIPYGTVMVGDAYLLPFETDGFDLVISSEMLEHVERPAEALAELARVARRWVLLSVPREPIWRTLNVARGAYLGDLGNTPGHINHWSSRGFARLVSRHMEIVERRAPLPWTVLLCRTSP